MIQSFNDLTIPEFTIYNLEIAIYGRKHYYRPVMAPWSLNRL